MGVATCRSDCQLLRHGLASSRPPPPPPWPGRPAASSSATARSQAACLPSSSRARPRRPPPPLWLRHGEAARRPPPPPPRSVARRPLPLPPRRPQAAGSRIAAKEGSAPPVVGAQSGPMGLMGRRALQCLGSGQHGTRGISAVPGPPPRPGGPTRPVTEVHRACIVPGRVGPGQIELGPGGPFEHL
jgi:hypothetical protein